MVFSSRLFLFLFLPVVLFAIFVCPRRARNTLLIVASLIFYAWGEPAYLPVMLASIAFNYAMGLWIGRKQAPSAPRVVLALAVVGNLALLGYFKYSRFVMHNLASVFPGLTELAEHCPTLDELPLGISFFTFQALSYVIDARRGEVAVQRKPLDLALYISLFPQLIAGPIVRYRDIASQIASRELSVSLFADGVRRFVVGLGKKVLIANSVGATADAVFGMEASQLTTLHAWIGIVCYTLQIYFDFSGYSDMAIGLGRMLGFRFLENFNYPYISASITEFWRRWHISLSTWFRDYLYIPLGGNRVSRQRLYLNLLIVFLLCGLWHGAQWTFVAWGLFHGTFLVLERVTIRERTVHAAWRPVRHVYVLAIVMVGWVLFRANSFAHASEYLAAMSGANGRIGTWLDTRPLWQGTVAWTIAFGTIGSTPIVPWTSRLLESVVNDRIAGGRPVAVVIVGYRLVSTLGLLAVLLASIVTVASETYNPFIYFRF